MQHPIKLHLDQFSHFCSSWYSLYTFQCALKRVMQDFKKLIAVINTINKINPLTALKIMQRATLQHNAKHIYRKD